MSGTFTELSALDTELAVPDAELPALDHEHTPLAMDPDDFDQMIRDRAFELYLARCETGVEGSPDADWEKAVAGLGDPVETIGSIRAPCGSYI